MKLRELEAAFLTIIDERITSFADVPFNEAQGVWFMCPKCYVKNSGPVGTHWVICWFADRGVPDDKFPLPGRWNPSGTCIDDLTFVGPGAASVLLTAPEGCGWHGFIRDGEAVE